MFHNFTSIQVFLLIFCTTLYSHYSWYTPSESLKLLFPTNTYSQKIYYVVKFFRRFCNLIRNWSNKFNAYCIIFISVWNRFKSLCSLIKILLSMTTLNNKHKSLVVPSQTEILAVAKMVWNKQHVIYRKCVSFSTGHIAFLIAL